MTGIDVLLEYLRLSDVMQQALKTGHYNIFERALEDRGNLVEASDKKGDLYEAFTTSEKEAWRAKIKEADKKVELAMENYKERLESELNGVNQSQAKLRKHSKVGAYYNVSQANQGRFINKLK